MPIGENKTVWILGAGFSKSLGAPLLVDLFHQELYEDLVETIGPERAARLTWTQALFNYGRGTRWNDAEDFLAYVEAAAGFPPHPTKKAFLDGIIHRGDFITAIWPVVDDRYTACRTKPLQTILHAFATETSEFLRFNTFDQEQWAPYLRWVRHLDPTSDSIVTFNYDRVLERLDEELESLKEERRLQIVLPNQEVRANRVPVFKLHGSTDWIRKNDDEVEPDPTAVQRDIEVVIAAPGRSKSSLTSTLLKPLWVEACKRIKHAGAVAVVGYGFPKTDAQARMELLDAFEADNSGAQTREVHLILGPDVNLPAHRRISELVRHRLGRRRFKFINQIPQRYLVPSTRLGVVVQHPLWAEDFIGDYISRTVERPLER